MSKRTIRVELSCDLVALGAAMREWRVGVGLTQGECAELVNVSASWWSCLEGGMSAPSKQGEMPSMRVFLDVVNLIHEDDSPSVAFRYFTFV